MIVEPTSDLWKAVKAVYDAWPPDNEDVADQLGADLAAFVGKAVAGRDGATTVSRALAEVWPDQAGAAVRSGIDTHAGNWTVVAQVALHQAGLAQRYSERLTSVKHLIDGTIAKNERLYDFFDSVSLMHPLRDSLVDSLAGAFAILVGEEPPSGTDGLGSRLMTLLRFELDEAGRAVDNPFQFLIDVRSKTFAIEQFAGVEGILGEGGQLYNSGPFPDQASLITGVSAFDAATTFGHTVRFASDEAPTDKLIAHEVQHVVDIETVGGDVFYISYIADGAAQSLVGHDPSHDIFWERRAYPLNTGPTAYPATQPRALPGGTVWRYLRLLGPL